MNVHNPYRPGDIGRSRLPVMPMLSEFRHNMSKSHLRSPELACFCTAHKPFRSEKAQAVREELAPYRPRSRQRRPSHLRPKIVQAERHSYGTLDIESVEHDSNTIPVSLMDRVSHRAAAYPTPVVAQASPVARSPSANHNSDTVNVGVGWRDSSFNPVDNENNHRDVDAMSVGIRVFDVD